MCKCAIISITYALEAMTVGEKGKNILKIKLLKIWEILNHRSEENAPISPVELIAALNDMGIACDRRTIYADIDCMQVFGYPIHNRRKGHDMLYWVDDGWNVHSVVYDLIGNVGIELFSDTLWLLERTTTKYERANL